MGCVKLRVFPCALIYRAVARGMVNGGGDVGQWPEGWLMVGEIQGVCSEQGVGGEARVIREVRVA